MPIYEYECLICGTKFEKRQSFSDKPQADCPHGHAETRRLIAAPAIVFKGSGFYVNDSKGKNSANGLSAGKNETSEPKTRPEPKTETKSEAKTETTKENA